MSNEIFVFMGPPGSGKGTLSELCVDELGWKQLSTGNLCRKHIKEGTEIGRQIDLAIKSGKLVSDDLISQMVEDFLLNKGIDSTIILDGYPRTVAQAGYLSGLLGNIEASLKVVRLLISDENVLTRLVGRCVCQNRDCQAVYSIVDNSLSPKQGMICDKCSSPLICREDDRLETVKERLKVYYEHENVLLDYYRSFGQNILELDVEDSIESVFEKFEKLVGYRRAND